MTASIYIGWTREVWGDKDVTLKGGTVVGTPGPFPDHLPLVVKTEFREDAP